MAAVTDRLTEIAERASALLDRNLQPVWHDADLGYSVTVEQIARDDVPWLIAEVKRLRERLADCEGLHCDGECRHG